MQRGRQTDGNFKSRSFWLVLAGPTVKKSNKNPLEILGGTRKALAERNLVRVGLPLLSWKHTRSATGGVVKSPADSGPVRNCQKILANGFHRFSSFPMNIFTALDVNVCVWNGHYVEQKWSGSTWCVTSVRPKLVSQLENQNLSLIDFIRHEVGDQAFLTALFH